MNLIDDLTLRIENLKKLREENSDQILVIRKKNSELTDEILELETQILTLKGNNITTENDEIEFYLDATDGDSDMFYARKKFFHKMNFTTGGYFSETNQVALDIALYGDESINEIMYDSIIKVLPFIKPLNGKDYDRNLVKIFTITEQNLAKDGSYCLIYDVELDEWCISKIYHYYRSEQCCAKSLKEILKYISTYLYYY